MSKLGYIGVDIALDAEHGPIVFELNARPGLGIQVANKAGLRWRLEKVKDVEVQSIKRGIRVAKSIFGGEVEESIEEISGRKVVNINEKILVYYRNVSKKSRQKRESANAFMDTGVITSRISETLANRIGFLGITRYFNNLDIPKKFSTLKEAQEYIDENEQMLTLGDGIKRVAKIVDDGEIKIRPVVEIRVKIAGEEKEMEVVILQNSEYHLIIGRGELKGYLIDTSKTFKG